MAPVQAVAAPQQLSPSPSLLRWSLSPLRYTPEQPWLLTWAHTMDSELLDQGWATLPSLGPGTPWARRQRSPTRCGDDVVGDVWRQGAAPGFFASSSDRQVCRQQQSSEEVGSQTRLMPNCPLMASDYN